MFSECVVRGAVSLVPANAWRDGEQVVQTGMHLICFSSKTQCYRDTILVILCTLFRDAENLSRLWYLMLPN